MKELVLHVGFPKTGSTALQDGLFYPLHQKGDMNFLGRSSQFFGLHDTRKEFNEAYGANQPHCLTLIPSSVWKEIQLVNDSVNLLSDENYTFPRGFLHSELDEVSSRSYLLDYLRFLKNSGIKLKVIVAIRNQADILFSLYVHWYGYLVQNKLVLEPTKFILKYLQNARFRSELSYHLWLEDISNLIGAENVMTFLFEAMKDDESFVLDKLLNFVYPDIGTIKKPNSIGIHNKKKESMGTYTTRPFIKRSGLRIVVSTLMVPDSKLYQLASGMLRKLIKPETQEVVIPKLSAVQKDEINACYVNSELLNYGFDRSDLLKYGYLK